MLHFCFFHVQNIIAYVHYSTLHDLLSCIHSKFNKQVNCQRRAKFNFCKTNKCRQTYMKGTYICLCVSRHVAVT